MALRLLQKFGLYHLAARWRCLENIKNARQIPTYLADLECALKEEEKYLELYDSRKESNGKGLVKKDQYKKRCRRCFRSVTPNGAIDHAEYSCLPPSKLIAANFVKSSTASAESLLYIHYPRKHRYQTLINDIHIMLY